MSLTSREPSTKFFGPNYPFVLAQTPNHWLVQLHNLHPGDSYDPVTAVELQSYLLFDAFINPPTWVFDGVDFFGRLLWRTNRMEIIIRARVGRAFVFNLNIAYVSHQWAINEIIVPTDNFAFGGTASVIFRKE